ncbi:uncharacterized protein EDB91DRAFT_737230 [Suillus paluster]|uniref:uncharacterized protein n=1 Tax=Suillus paluster TaxID=48578 RepID=UPI001B87DD2A|nr:uncharacterized protein EDB91DRAFT_737230 [Suillus paluster]KAG1730950.1 hypothetical protein EDB91DRAFT_737230 [Suillus paluster]
MTLLPLAILLCVTFVCASQPSLNGTCVPSLDISDSPSRSDTRTLWDILWSCAATLFACAWTAIHPNIPGMKEGKLTITSRRLLIMVMALIAPELMITWAARQFFSARAAAKEFNDEFGSQHAQAHGDHGDIAESTATLLREISELDERSTPKAAVRNFREWTMAHGFFAWMGGFMLNVDDKPRATLDPDELLDFVRKGSMDMPIITEAEIEDRSKGDGLSKGIAILQLVWFVLQLIARYAQNLPITLLEIDTLAVSALTCITYCLWWKKPKNVGCPYTVHWKTTASPPSNLAYDESNITHALGCDCFPYFTYLTYPITSLMGFEVTISPRAARSHRVPSLGGYGGYHDVIILLIGCFCGIVFGGIHCLGWNFLFHRQTEQLLWRTASLMIICSPVPILLCSGFFMSGIDDSSSALIFIIKISLGIASVISALIYIAARVTIIVLMILSLQSLPSGIYDTVAWTNFFPHV